MSSPSKLDWIPLYIHRLKGSPAYKLPDFQFCWFFKLLIESCDSVLPGYLPERRDELWRLAGAKSETYFQKWGGPELVSRLFKRTEIDGLVWIYNERLLAVIHEQTGKLKRKSPLLSLSVSSDFAELIYQDYPRKEGHKLAIEAIRKSIGRHMKRAEMSDVDASQFIHQAVIEFAKSPAGKRTKVDTGETLVPHPSTWFNQDRYMDDRSNWYVEPKARATGNSAASRVEQRIDSLSRTREDARGLLGLVKPPSAVLPNGTGRGALSDGRKDPIEISTGRRESGN